MQMLTRTSAVIFAAMALTGAALAEDAMKPAGTMAGDAMKPADAMAGDAMGGDAMGGAMMADDSMMMMATKAGEVIAISPSGAMGTMMMEGDKMMSTIGMSAALDHCVMFITGEDGKVYQVDTMDKMGAEECEAIAK